MKQRPQPSQAPVTPWEIQESEFKRVAKAWGSSGPVEAALLKMMREEASKYPELTDEEWIANEAKLQKWEDEERAKGVLMLTPKPRTIEDRIFWRSVTESEARAQKPRSEE